MFKKNVCTTVVVFTLCSVLFAAESQKVTLTIEQAVEQAKKSSRMLKTAAIDLEITKLTRDTVWGNFFPVINANGAVSRANTVTSITIPGITSPKVTEKDHWSAAGTLSASLSLNAMLVNSIRSAYAGYDSGLITWEQTLKETERDVRKMFYSILFIYENLKLQKTMLENSRQRWIQAQINYRSGLVPELTVLQAQVAYETRKPAILEIEQTVSKQLSLFAFLLGYPYTTQVELSGVIEPIYYTLNAVELIDEYAGKNLAVLSLMKNIDIMKLQLSASKAGTFIPSLTFNYSTAPAISPITENWGSTNSWTDRGSFSVSLSWNLSNMLPFSQNMVGIKTRHKNLDQMTINLDTLRENSEMEITTLVNGMEKSKSSIGVQKLNISVAQKAYNLTVEAFNAGTKELLDVRDAETQLNQTQIGVLQEELNYMLSLLDLEHALNTNFSSEK